LVSLWLSLRFETIFSASQPGVFSPPSCPVTPLALCGFSAASVLLSIFFSVPELLLQVGPVRSARRLCFFFFQLIRPGIFSPFFFFFFLFFFSLIRKDRPFCCCMTPRSKFHSALFSHPLPFVLSLCFHQIFFIKGKFIFLHFRRQRTPLTRSGPVQVRLWSFPCGFPKTSFFPWPKTNSARDGVHGLPMGASDPPHRGYLSTPSPSYCFLWFFFCWCCMDDPPPKKSSPLPVPLSSSFFCLSQVGAVPFSCPCVRLEAFSPCVPSL